jgi:hypothetical protein
MTFTDYLLNGFLVALVILQIHGVRLTVRMLIIPVVVVGIVAFEYLHGIQGGGNNLLLVVAGALLGLVLGSGCGLATAVYRNDRKAVMSKAGLLAAVLWVAGVGARLAFAIYATHGGATAIGNFSVAHHITSGQTWANALLLMALAEVMSRSAVLAVKYWTLRSPANTALATAASAD